MIMYSMQLIASLIGSSVSLALILYDRKKHKNVLKEINSCDTDSVYKFIYIRLRNRSCIPHVTQRKTCSKYCSLNYVYKVLDEIRDAKKSIFIGAYHITINMIFKVLINAHKAGLDVRVITDRTMLEMNTSKILHLKDTGVPIKTQSKEQRNSFLHHKFILIDSEEEDRRLLFGSINYTTHAFCLNWEHIVWTNNRSQVKAFTEEFHELWRELNFI